MRRRVRGKRSVLFAVVIIIGVVVYIFLGIGNRNLAASSHMALDKNPDPGGQELHYYASVTPKSFIGNPNCKQIYCDAIMNHEGNLSRSQEDG